MGAGIATFTFLFGSENLQNAVANGDTRSITMRHTHTGEDITVTFKREGRYDEEGLKKLNWFLRDWRTDEPTRMDAKLFDIVWEVYREADGKQPINIISAFRSPKTNAMLRRRGRGVAQFSQHMAGKAMDFHIPGVPLEEIRAAGLRLQRGGVGFYPTSGSPFVHIDTGTIRHWPRMSRDQLARVFPNGRTVHVPSDGRPLAGHALAMAEVESRGGTVSPAASATDTDTEQTSNRVGNRSKQFFAKLFGFRGDEDEDAAEASRPAKTRIARTESAPPAAAPRVPLPPSRPVTVERSAGTSGTPSTGGGFALASATSVPVDKTPARIALAPSAPSAPVAPEIVRQSPADTVATRGLWRGSAEGVGANSATEARPTAAAAQGNGAIGTPGTRFVWITGPQGQPVDRTERRSPESAREKAGAIPAETTASVAPWPMTGTREARDRVPAEIALAYAAEASTPPAPQRAAPMGTLRQPWQQARPQTPTPPPSPSAAPTPAPAPISAKPGQRHNDPWLRGVVLAPSVHYSMSVAVFGSVDYRSLRPLMQKPPSVVAMSFSPDPHSGMTTIGFAGAAINFVPIISFGQQTAQLN